MVQWLKSPGSHGRWQSLTPVGELRSCMLWQGQKKKRKRGYRSTPRDKSSNQVMYKRLAVNTCLLVHCLGSGKSLAEKAEKH